MSDPDDIIALGVQSIKSQSPSKDPSDLVLLYKSRARRSTLARRFATITAFAGAAAVLAIALRPESAMAILNESARLTASEPIVHLHLDVRRTRAEATAYPWPPDAPLDIWRFPDHYIRKKGHITYEAFRNGHTFAYDDRFATGFEGSYDSAGDRFWGFDGTIGIALSEQRSQPKISNVSRSGSDLIRYEWAKADQLHRLRQDIYVDPKSKLIRSTEEHRIESDGDHIDEWTSLDYPNQNEAAQGAVRFPSGLHFDTKQELIEAFDHTISRPAASADVAGVHVTLYGVIVFANTPDGLGILAITKGSDQPPEGTGHSLKIEGAQLLPAKRFQYFEPVFDPTRRRDADYKAILGRQYLVYQSEDLLVRAPQSLTLQVPVWRHQRFLGYARFKTSKLYYNTGEGDWNFY